MIKKFGCFLLMTFFLMFSGCDITKVLQSTYNMTNCEYHYRSISNLTIANINISNGISVLQMPQLLAVLNGSTSSIPLDFTLNLNVHNPNATQAAFQALQYIIQIDDIDFTNGYLTQPFNVGAGETQPLPIHIGVDIASLISNHSASAILNIVKNFIGIGSDKSNVTVQLKPTFNMGGSRITSPVFIPVSFSFGGK